MRKASEPVSVMDAPSANVSGAAATERLVIFDFDGTILEGQSPVMFVRALVANRVMPFPIMLSIFLWAVRYKLHLPHQQSEVRERIFSIFTKVPAKRANEMMIEVYKNEVEPNLRVQALERIAYHKQRGEKIIFVSASFEPIMEQAVSDLGVYGQVSTRMQIVDGYYTGNVEGLPVEGDQKPIRLTAFANEHFGEGNWQIVCAYGDHYSDEPLLTMATEAIAVTPDKGLERVARLRGWKIVDWSYPQPPESNT